MALPGGGGSGLPPDIWTQIQSIMGAAPPDPFVNPGNTAPTNPWTIGGNPPLPPNPWTGPGGAASTVRGSGPGGEASYGPWNHDWDKYGTPASNAAGFSPWGGPTADGPPAWLAQEALKAYQAGDQARMKHLLDSAMGPDGPKGSLAQHIIDFLKGLFAGDPDRINEAKYYGTNPSAGGIPSGIGDGIPGDGR